jgi:DNA replication and checkpoint protein
MEGGIALLDTPRKASLQSQSTDLRAALKDFERNFAADHAGRKPSKDDIKADAVVARKYKEYSKIRDVLAGKLGLVALEAPSPSKKRKSHSGSEIAVTGSPAKQRLRFTPRKKRLRPDDIDPYDAPSSVTPRRILTAIGPTPQRDGQVLGIFDLLSNPGSGESLQATPSNRKRKIATLMGEDDDVENLPIVAQTPSQQPSKKGSDLLDHLAGTPVSQLKTTRHKHSRTPVSDGKKFMLSQFFATPSAVRYTEMTGAEADPTPLRNRVLGLSPAKAPQQERASDATPAYLRRSYSFKDRLLSASSNPSRDNSSEVDASSPSSVRNGPWGVSGRQVRFKPKPLSQIAAEMRKREDEMHDDDLDAMRELEDADVGVLVGDSLSPSNTAGQNIAEQAPQGVWKKKGQKRTTRRVIMRPSTVKTRDKPASQDDAKGIDAKEVSEDEGHANPNVDDDDDDDLFNDLENDLNDQSEDGEDAVRPTKKSKTKEKDSNPLGKPRKPAEEPEKKRTYNPNATSHQNFRSLKIKNKNSKAKGRSGRGRFGKR